VSRLFVAVWPPDEILDAIAALPRADEPGVRWTRRDQWHVTLRFLGRAEMETAVAALNTVRWGAVPPTRVELAPAVSRLGRSVICLPASGAAGLAESVTDATADVGEPPDPRPFTGHLTLARLRGRGACRLAGHRFEGSFLASEVTLVESRPAEGGTDYAVVARFPLEGA
jgi:RNA 2',3'-cyclic 3'-phosphodiesterase